MISAPFWLTLGFAMFFGFLILTWTIDALKATSSTVDEGALHDIRGRASVMGSLGLVFAVLGLFALGYRLSQPSGTY